MLELPPVADRSDALSQPTRSQLFALLNELKRPAGTEELAQLLELHPNGVRLHLERLEQAGLLERQRLRGRRGRPPDLWVIATEARPGGEPPRAYADMVRWLARAIAPTRSNLSRVQRTGREIGRELAPERSAGQPAGAPALVNSLAALGFQPRLKEKGAGMATITLCNCPYREAVDANQPVVCGLHHGLTGGLIDSLLPAARISSFEPRDPASAGCLIELEGLDQSS